MVNVEKPIIAEKVKRLISDKMGVRIDEISESDDLYNEIGMDSLDTIELELDLESHYEISIPDEELEKWKTVGDIVEYLDGVLNTLGV